MHAGHSVDGPLPVSVRLDRTAERAGRPVVGVGDRWASGAAALASGRWPVSTSVTLEIVDAVGGGAGDDGERQRPASAQTIAVRPWPASVTATMSFSPGSH